MGLKLAFYLHFRCSVVVCRWNSGMWGLSSERWKTQAETPLRSAYPILEVCGDSGLECPRLQLVYSFGDCASQKDHHEASDDSGLFKGPV